MVTTRNQAKLAQQASKDPAAIKLATALREPLSHPIATQASSPRAANVEDVNFRIAAVQGPPGAVGSAPTHQPPVRAVQPAPLQPPRRLQPSEKLLMPLPDKPIECTKLPDGPEPSAIEVEYLPREQLQPVENDAEAALADALVGMASSQWTVALEALNMLRRLATHHAAVCVPSLPAAVPLVVKSIRNLRSALCKTAIMSATDLYASFADAMLPHTDAGGAAQPVGSLLAQLLLKAASNDKKFVIEEAQRALDTLADLLPPSKLLRMLAPYTEHKHPKVRGKAAGVAAAAALRLTPADAAAYGLPLLLMAAGRLITDNTPEAREAAKRMADCVKAAVSDATVEQQLGIEVPPAPVEGEEPGAVLIKWEYFCQTTLGPTAAAAVLRAVE